MKRILTIVFITGFCTRTVLMAQQIPQYTQFMFNPFLYNPAIAGVEPHYQIRSTHRFQWIGIEDPPVTNALCFHGPHGELNMGYGGYLYHDVTGPTSKTGVTGSYAYNIGLGGSMRLSMGVSFGMIQYRVDGTQINLKNPNDDAIEPGVHSSYVPDANFGLYLYSENYYAGFSTSQLVNSKMSLTEEGTGLNKLHSHFFLTGGYRFELNTNFAVEPSLMVRGTAPLQVQADVNTRVIYQDKVWTGLSYRSQDALSLLLGYVHENKIYLGYSYDFTMTDLRKYHSGSHEIMIGYRFNDIK